MSVISLILILSITRTVHSNSLLIDESSVTNPEQRDQESDKYPVDSVDIVPDKTPDDDPDDPGPYVEPTKSEPTGPPDIVSYSWSNVSTLDDVPCNLRTTPLQIKTAGLLIGEKEINLEVGFVGGKKKALVIGLRSSPQVQITGCTESPVLLSNVSHLVGAEVIVWTISKSETSLTIVSNNVESLIYKFSESTTNCSDYWQGNTTHVTFTTSDSASRERRLKPENCTAIPGTFPGHFNLDKNFPVSPGTEVGVTCVHGEWNIGDSSIICNTNLYTDFEYKHPPWCLGMKTYGSEVMEGSRTTLTCLLSNVPREGNYDVHWTLNGNKTTEGVETGDAVDGERRSTVIVKRGSLELDYWCHVGGQRDWSRKVALNIFTMQDVSKDTKVGDTSILGCFVRNIAGHPKSPTIVWKKGETVLTTGPKYKIETKMQVHEATSYLEVKEPSGDSNYTCQVTSGLYPTSPSGTKTVTLNTYTMSTECVIRSKEQSVVACKVEDISDQMKISWYREDVELKGALQSFERGVQRSVLFLTSGTVDEERYTCRVDSIKRPESVPSDQFVVLATIEPETGPTSLLTSPVIWCLVAVSVVLCAAVGTLSGYLLKVRNKMETLTFRLSTREKIDSISQRPDTILRNRTAPQTRDVESLRRTLDRRPPNVHMSEITDKSSEGDDVFE